MATIEPRLIHLLNDSPTPHVSHAYPPSGASSARTTAPARTTTPTATASALGQYSRGVMTSSPSVSLSSPSSSSSLSSGVDVMMPMPLPPLLYDAPGIKGGSLTGGFAPYPPYLDDAGAGIGTWLPAPWNNNEPARIGRDWTPPPLIAADSHPSYLGTVMGSLGPEHHIQVDDTTTKKRRATAVKDDLVQLPQPVKKQRADSRSQIMAPIVINGLNEPPSQGTLLPPISDDIGHARSLHDAGAFHNEFPNDTHGRVLPQIHVRDLLLEDEPLFRPELGDSPRSKHADTDVDADADASQAHHHGQDDMAASPASVAAVKPRRRPIKPRRKWTDEETRNLLLGVNKHGVGKWTVILEDDEFCFAERSAGDLKDRFRTCCPAELRRTHSNGAGSASSNPLAEPLRSRPRTGLLSENILIDESPARDMYEHDEPDSPPPPSQSAWTPTDASCPAKQRKSRAHRKKLEELAEMGIHGPFKQSHRRERRPFTDQDDGDILQGLEQYGPAWTKIQRDPRFNLSSRQPTDLRDRVRNKYPEIYSRIEKNSSASHAKDSTAPAPDRADRAHSAETQAFGAFAPRSSVTGTKNVTAASHKSISPERGMGGREDMPRWAHSILDSADMHSAVSRFSGASPHHHHHGDMDISKLLIDDGQATGSFQRQ